MLDRVFHASSLISRAQQNRQSLYNRGCLVDRLGAVLRENLLLGDEDARRSKGLNGLPDHPQRRPGVLQILAPLAIPCHAYTFTAARVFPAPDPGPVPAPRRASTSH